MHSDYLIPFAKRGRALIFVCHPCYHEWHYMDYYFQPHDPLRRIP